MSHIVINTPASITITRGDCAGSDLSNYATVPYVTGISGAIVGLISASSAGVSTLNGGSGALVIVGQSGIGVQVVGQNILVSYTGEISATGDYYPRVSGELLKSQTGFYALASNLGATGLNLQNQISVITSWTGTTTGLFINRAESGQFSSDADLLSTSGYLASLISASAAGVGTLNGLSGSLIISGQSGIGISVLGQRIVVSVTGNYFPTISGELLTAQTGLYALASNLGASGINLQNQILGITSWTGTTTGLYYPRNANPSGFVTGSVVRPTETGVFVTRAESGQFFSSNSGTVLVAQTGLFALATNLGATGINLQNQIIGVTNWTGITTGLYYPRFSNPSGYITADQTGQFASDAELLAASGYLVTLISASSAGVSSLNAQSGTLNLVGAGNIAITTGVGTITISGNTGDYANFVRLTQTGQFASDADVNTLSGFLLNAISLHTGGVQRFNNQTGNLFITGQGSVTVYSGANGVWNISGAGSAGGSAGVVSLNNQTGALRLTGQGNVTVYSGQSGLWNVSGTTGDLASLFYPRNNPSGFITSATGATVLDGQILIGATGTNSFEQGNLAGLSGIIIQSGSGSLSISINNNIIVTNTTSGQFYPRVGNPSGFLTSASALGVVSLNNQTGALRITGQSSVTVYSGANGLWNISGITFDTGTLIPMFARTSELQTTNNWTGTTTGLYYPRNNPSGFLTGIIAGTNITVGNNGNGTFTINSTASGASGSANTGELTGAFYPLNANPSGYIPSSFVTGRQTIWLPAGAISAGTTSGAAAGQVALGLDMPDVISLDFDAASAEHGLFSIAMPKSWDVGPIFSQFVWSHAVAAGGGVVWRLQGFAFNDGESLSGVFAGGVQVTDTSVSGLHQYISPETAAYTISGNPSVNDVIYFRVSRLPADAADTLAVDAKLMGIKLIYSTTGARD